MKKFSFKEVRNKLMAAAGVLVVAVIFCGLFTCCKKNDEKKTVSKNETGFVKKIVCLNPGGAEILFALGKGDLICARSSFCDYPEKILDIPDIGGFDGKSISLEKIISFKPDFVYGSKEMHDFLKLPLEKFGIELYLSEVKNISDLMAEIEYIGRKTNSIASAGICNNIKMELESIAEAHKAQERKTVYWEVWNEPFVTCGKNSFINDIIYAAGGKNIFDDLDEDYPMVSQESIIAKNPQVIIIPDANGISVQNVIQRNGWENLAAVKLMNVSLIDSNISSRPSPRIIEAVKLVEKILWR